VTAEFNRHGESYEEEIAESIGFSGLEHAFFLEAKAEALLQLVRRRLGDPQSLRALDVGCGFGLLHPYLSELGALEGVDVSEAMISEARTRNPDVRYRVADGRELPAPDASFDLALAVCVLHHVPEPERGTFVGELGRVVRPGGLVVVFEHNPFNPLTRLAVRRCAFDEDVTLLRRRAAQRLLHRAGLASVDSAYILFFPWRSGVTRRMERALTGVPLGAQYFVGAQAADSQKTPG
jgi:SAM-dependent methyltransferase